MRAMTACLMTFCLMGCHSGPRWFMRDRGSCGSARCADQPVYESAPRSEVDHPQLPPLPSDRETSSTPSRQSRGLLGTSVVNRESRPASNDRRPSTSPRSSGADESVRQLMADLEKIKREKRELQDKLHEETVKQSQQRLELEARMLVLQEQLRQQTALQQVAYQQQAGAMSRSVPTYSGPVISSSATQPTNSSVPAWNPQSASAWNSSATPSWNAPVAPTQSSIELWPYSQQRR